MPDPTPVDPPAPEQTPTDVPEPVPEPVVHLGDAVRLRRPLRYLKTADPMPMLRPPDLVDPGEVGRVVEIRALELRAIRFRRGTFLINLTDLEPVSPDG
ncbi:NAD(P)H dehydrogenase assembly family protein [Synechococcus sp. BA-132 BA5]|uniref:NAD(P)H dehydrogenase assembly family protein n=1 Tax=Synechococcus sp. BA-132 BA5 TaxID=3110252 RepID=UPI002B21B8C4|nr:NAD(P)H dehydrogenase assembly family protein [Synechococcus sp. BA-132 BA5]MEA5416326.1 NAD(P)H dehydrogenase assembly family protein [Synechococcus sp. BA-132 BA5]